MARPLSDLGSKLRLVRRFTGDRFSAKRGYDMRGKMSKARQKTIARYFQVIQELTAKPHIVITPPKGGKLEAFEYTGQRGHSKFVKAIVTLPDPGGRYKFEIDRLRPKGSRFILINRTTREKSWHIPADVFYDVEPDLGFDLDEDLPPEFFADIIEEYGYPGRIYMIEAGEHHMWGDAGPPARVGAKLAQLFVQYGAGHFDSSDRNSHFIGNWFRGVSVFHQADAITYGQSRFAERARSRAERRAQGLTVLPTGHKWRPMINGMLGEFINGEWTGRQKPKAAQKHRRSRKTGRKN